MLYWICVTLRSFETSTKDCHYWFTRRYSTTLTFTLEESVITAASTFLHTSNTFMLMVSFHCSKAWISCSVTVTDLANCLYNFVIGPTILANYGMKRSVSWVNQVKKHFWWIEFTWELFLYLKYQVHSLGRWRAVFQINIRQNYYCYCSQVSIQI